jgi:hypothetical protein
MTPEQYKELYEKYDVKPRQTVYITNEPKHGECRACAIGIRFIEHFGDINKAQAACRSAMDQCSALNMWAHALGGSDDFWKGLDRGFTDYPEEGPHSFWSSDFVAGWTEGAAVAKYLHEQGVLIESWLTTHYHSPLTPDRRFA